jgi:hypothetical protein
LILSKEVREISADCFIDVLSLLNKAARSRDFGEVCTSLIPVGSEECCSVFFNVVLGIFIILVDFEVNISSEIKWLF